MTTTPMDSLRYELPYTPPLPWDMLLDFIAGRVVRGVEMRDGDIYRRTVRMGKATGYLSVTPQPGRGTVQVELSASLAGVSVPVLAQIKRLFDLDAAPDPIAERLGALAQAHPGLRVPGAFDGFEMAVRAILGQQVTVKAATTLAGRFAAAFGTPITTPYAELAYLFPTPERVGYETVDSIAALGIIGSRAKSILALAEAVANGAVSLCPSGDPTDTMTALKKLPGVGEWTAQYVAMRALSYPDAFPHTDLGIYKALGTSDPKAILALAEAWRPWRSYAVMHLWKSLETKA